MRALLALIGDFADFPAIGLGFPDPWECSSSVQSELFTFTA